MYPSSPQRSHQDGPCSSSQGYFYRARSVIWLLGLLVPHPVVVGRDDVAGRVDRDNA